MLTELAEGENVVAFSFRGRIEKADVERAMARLDAGLAGGGPVHLFIELCDFQGMSVDACFSDLAHGLRYLPLLRQFGRVAIVSEQSYIRTASRIESALLPFITYEVYVPDQRDHALAWVRGEVAEAHPDALRILDEGDDSLLVFVIDGRITPTAIDGLYDRFSEMVRDDRKLKILALFRRYDGFDPAVLVNPKYLHLKLLLLKKVERYAIVGAPEWIDRAVDYGAPLLSFGFRHFASDDEAGARAWLQAADVSS